MYHNNIDAPSAPDTVYILGSSSGYRLLNTVSTIPSNKPAKIDFIFVFMCTTFGFSSCTEF